MVAAMGERKTVMIVVCNPPLDMNMIKAGVVAYKAWNEREEEIESLVVAVYLNMVEEMP